MNYGRMNNTDLIERQVAIDTVMKFMPSLTTPDGCGQFDREIYETQEMFVDIGQALNELPSAQPELDTALYSDGFNDGYAQCKKDAQSEIAGNLYQYKCYITDREGLQHEVIHTDDIRRITGWMI